MKNSRNTRASRRVLKKLSAVRAVLPRDEREVLDAIVLGEVKTHQASETPVSQPTAESTSDNQRKDHEMLGKDNPISKVSNIKGQVKAHTAGGLKGVGIKGAGIKGQVKAHSTGLKGAGVKGAGIKGAGIKGQVKAHAIVNPQPPVEHTPAPVPPVELPKVEFDPTLEQYKPIAE